MKILLISDSQAVANVVGMCLDKPNFELLNDISQIDNCDLTIKDLNLNDTDFSNFNLSKTLFLVEKANFDDIDVKYKLTKPFLPTELIEFLSNYESNLQNTRPAEQENDFVPIKVDLQDDNQDMIDDELTIAKDNPDILSKSLESTQKNDMENLSMIIKEIDDLEKGNDSPLSINDEVLLKNLDENEPLDKFAKELSDKLLAIDSIKLNTTDEIELQDPVKNLNDKSEIGDEPILLDNDFKLDLEDSLKKSIIGILENKISKEDLKSLRINIKIDFEDRD